MSNLQTIVSAMFADRHGQPLEDWIADRRETTPPTPWRTVARELYEMTDGLVDLAPQTLINWTADDREAVA